MHHSTKIWLIVMSLLILFIILVWAYMVFIYCASARNLGVPCIE
jgi:hypothetical protein